MPVVGKNGEEVLDVRPIAPREKHASIFRLFDGLSTGESMVIVNDHDPKPLYYQFLAERNGTFDWHYVESGPITWRVRIHKVATSGHPSITVHPPSSA